MFNSSRAGTTSNKGGQGFGTAPRTLLRKLHRGAVPQKNLKFAEVELCGAELLGCRQGTDQGPKVLWKIKNLS